MVDPQVRPAVGLHRPDAVGTHIPGAEFENDLPLIETEVVGTADRSMVQEVVHLLEIRTGMISDQQVHDGERHWEFAFAVDEKFPITSVNETGAVISRIERCIKVLHVRPVCQGDHEILRQVTLRHSEPSSVLEKRG